MESIGVIGGTNVQFAHDPATGRVVIIEINPRTSRSSALASKATGFPIALISAKLASGMTLQVFMTGRGTPYGLAAAPVIKVSSRSDLKDMWSDLIDVDAGVIASGGSDIRTVGQQLFREIVEVASGRKRPAAERYRLFNDICLFNPAPIT